MLFTRNRRDAAKRFDGRPTRRRVLRRLGSGAAGLTVLPAFARPAAATTAPAAGRAASRQPFRIGYHIFSFGRYFPRNLKFDGWIDVELDSSRTQTFGDVARDAREFLTNRLGLALSVPGARP